MSDEPGHPFRLHWTIIFATAVTLFAVAAHVRDWGLVLCGIILLLFAGKQFIQDRGPSRDCDEPKKPDRKRRRWPSAVPYVILTPLVYMGAYYATVAHPCGEQNGHYMIGDAQLPYCFEVFFAPADKVEQLLGLGPCRPVPVRH
jgi:hypothetical protein